MAETERRAGDALRQMTEAEGLTLREAVEWCGEQIPVREATRLRRLGQVVEEMANSPDLRPAAAKLAEKVEREAAGDADGESAAVAAGTAAG